MASSSARDQDVSMGWRRDDFFQKARGRAQSAQSERTGGRRFCELWIRSTPEGHAEAEGRYLEKILPDLGIKAEVDIYDAFGGVLDLSSSAPIFFPDSRMLGMAAKQMVKDTGIHLKEGARNDLRDWDQIQTFTEHFAQLLKAGDGAN
jgi:hypothetical protein